MTHKPQLSKSHFISGTQCHLRLWYDSYAHGLADSPDGALQAIVDTGHEVGEVACRRYPADHRIAHDHRHIAQALEETRQVVGADSAPAVFEATFAHGQVLVRADIIERLPAGGWRLVEVKSSTWLKEVFVLDAAVQLRVLRGAGLDVREAAMLTLSSCGGRRYEALYPKRQALWVSAQAIHVFPTPAGPVISKLRRSRIQRLSASDRTRSLSRPRGWRKSMSSIQARCRSLARRSRFVICRELRSVSSRSTSSPRRSSNDRASSSGEPSCSAKAVAMPGHRSWWSLSMVWIGVCIGAAMLPRLIIPAVYGRIIPTCNPTLWLNGYTERFGITTHGQLDALYTRDEPLPKTRPPRFLDDPCVHAPLFDPGKPPTPIDARDHALLTVANERACVYWHAWKSNG